MLSTRFPVAIALVGLLASSAIGMAQDVSTKLPSFLTDHMVLQRNVANRIWGWDKPGAEVSVSAGSATARATANAEGQWSTQLPPMQAGGPIDITVKGTTEIKLTDVLFVNFINNAAHTIAASAAKYRLYFIIIQHLLKII